MERTLFKKKFSWTTKITTGQSDWISNTNFKIVIEREAARSRATDARRQAVSYSSARLPHASLSVFFAAPLWCRAEPAPCPATRVVSAQNSRPNAIIYNISKMEYKNKYRRNYYVYWWVIILLVFTILSRATDTKLVRQ